MQVDIHHNIVQPKKGFSLALHAIERVRGYVIVQRFAYVHGRQKLSKRFVIPSIKWIDSLLPTPAEPNLKPSIKSSRVEMILEPVQGSGG